MNPASQIDIGCGKGKEFNGLIKGGLEGIVLDGRGREIIFDSNKNKTQYFIMFCHEHWKETLTYNTLDEKKMFNYSLSAEERS